MATDGMRCLTVWLQFHAVNDFCFVLLTSEKFDAEKREWSEKNVFVEAEVVGEFCVSNACR